MTLKLLLPEAARRWLARRYDHQHRAWSSGEGAWPLSVPLGEPTEKAVAADTASVREWVDAWSAWRDPGEVEWVDRRWPTLGSQRLPARLVLGAASDVARLVGEAERFERARERRLRLLERWSPLAASGVLARHFDTLADYSAADFERLFSLLTWLDENPSSGKYLRQLPIEGMDTKWCDAKRRALVVDLLATIRGSSSARDFYELCGLCRQPPRLRLRLLCHRLREAIGGLGDLEAPLEQIASLRIRPALALIVENLETGVALPELPGCVAFMKLGFGVSLLGDVPWLQHARALYWGDLDTHGFAILSQARAALPGLRSVLMDERTLLESRALWGREAAPYAGAEPTRLTPDERSLYERLRANAWGQGVRLEQERVPWGDAMQAVRAALESARLDG